MKRLLLPLGVAALACARPPVPPPELFPLRSAWTVALGDEILAPLAASRARVFAASRPGGVRALDPGTGAVVWHDSEREGRLATDGEALFVRAPDGRVWRLDAGNGTPRWQAASGVSGDVAPTVAEGRVIVAGRGLAALDAVSGETLWSAPDASETLLPPAAASGRVVVVDRDGAVHCHDAATGISLWKHPFPSALLATPAVGERSVFVGTTDRRFVALDLENGRQRWRWKLGADVDAPPTLLHGNVLFASVENVLYALSTRSGNLAWRRPLPSRPLGAPQLLGSAVVLATRGRELLGFNGITGRQMGSLSLAAEIATPPVAVADLLVAGLRDRSVAAVTTTQPIPRPGDASPRLDK